VTATTNRRFPIRIGARSALFLRIAFGVTPETAWVEIADGQVIARFGRFEFTVPVTEIASWRIEGPWLWVTAIGVRMSVRRHDLSFAGSPRGGVRMDFARPVHKWVFDVPALYVGTEDLEGFAAALSDIGIPGEDARTA
jgi:hypothetical protein